MFDTISAMNAIPRLRHFISIRLGGVSTGEYSTLNLGYHVGDDPVNVTENRRRFTRAIGCDPAALVAAQQVHGTGIARVGTVDRGRGAFGWADAVPETDGFIVTDSLVPVAIQVADCAPVLIADPVRHVLAVVHAGWRGALGGIASAAVRQMGSDPADIQVGIGPTLCPACLEVGEEVASAVEEAYGPSAVPRQWAKPHLDIHAMLATDLGRVGVSEEQIHRHRECTRCTPHLFFSHRGQQGKAGRFALVAWWEG